MSLFARPPFGRKVVTYLHHTRDRDGDVVLYFRDSNCREGEFLQSSPVKGVSRCLSAVVDARSRGSLGRYLVTTENTCYEIQMPREKAEHLMVEVGVFEPPA